VHAYKPFYFPGETVRGSIIIDLFNNLPRNFKQIMLRVTGREHVGRHLEKVIKALKTSRSSGGGGPLDSMSRKSLTNQQSIDQSSPGLGKQKSCEGHKH